jgi:hypothetical protein
MSICTKPFDGRLLATENSETYIDTENETGQCQWVLQRTTR